MQDLHLDVHYREKWSLTCSVLDLFGRFSNTWPGRCWKYKYIVVLGMNKYRIKLDFNLDLLLNWLWRILRRNSSSTVSRSSYETFFKDGKSKRKQTNKTKCIFTCVLYNTSTAQESTIKPRKESNGTSENKEQHK